MLLLLQNQHFRTPGKGHEALSVPACKAEIISSFHNGGMKAKPWMSPVGRKRETPTS